MTRPFASGRVRNTAPLAELPLPFSLDPASFPGARVLGDDGQAYTSQRWPAPSDPFQWVSTAQIAEDVSANVARLLPPELLITVSNTGPTIPGQHYTSINQALEFATGFVRNHSANIPFRETWIKLLSGYKLDEQVILLGVDCSNISIMAEDLIVDVDMTKMTRQTDIEVQGAATDYVHAVFSGVDAILPNILGVLFRPDSGVIPEDPVRVARTGPYTPRSLGISARGNSTLRLNLRNRTENNVAITPRAAGFTEFWYNAFGSPTSIAFVNGANLNAGVSAGARLLGVSQIIASTATACGPRGGIRVGGNAVFSAAGAGQDATFAGVFSQDFRRTPGADAADDVIVENGFIRINSVTNFRGGRNVPDNTVSERGVVFALNQPNRTYTRDNVVGTVSQVANVPTGAIVQRGANANGSFVRFADGTQICWTTSSVNLAIDIPYFGGFRSLVQTPAFPAEFNTSLAIAGFALPLGSTAFGVIQGVSALSTGWSWGVTSLSTQTSATRLVSLIAIGRWF